MQKYIIQRTIAKFYKEHRVYTKSANILYKFKIEISKIYPEQSDIEAYYYIDVNNRFWFSEDFYYMIIYSDDEPEKKYIDLDIFSNQGMFVLWDEKCECRDIFVDLLEMIKSNCRMGTPRKKYNIPGTGIKVNISDDISKEKEVAEQIEMYKYISSYFLETVTCTTAL